MPVLNSNFVPIPRFLMLYLPTAVQSILQGAQTPSAPIVPSLSGSLKASVDVKDLDALVGGRLVDVTDGARRVGDERHCRRVVVQALGHAGLAGKDQAAPSRAVGGVALADVRLEKLLICRPVFEQDGHHLAAVFERGRVAGEDVFQI